MASHRVGLPLGHGLRGLQSLREVLLSRWLRGCNHTVRDGLETLLEWYNYIFIYMNTFLERYCLSLRLVVQNLGQRPYSYTIGRPDRNEKARSWRACST